MRRAVRSSAPYARMTEAPTTDSPTADSMSPTCSRTTPYARDSQRWKQRSANASGVNTTQTSSASGQE